MLHAVTSAVNSDGGGGAATAAAATAMTPMQRTQLRELNAKLSEARISIRRAELELDFRKDPKKALQRCQLDLEHVTRELADGHPAAAGFEQIRAELDALPSAAQSKSGRAGAGRSATLDGPMGASTPNKQPSSNTSKRRIKRGSQLAQPPVQQSGPLPDWCKVGEVAVYTAPDKQQKNVLIVQTSPLNVRTAEQSTDISVDVSSLAPISTVAPSSTPAALPRSGSGGGDSAVDGSAPSRWFLAEMKQWRDMLKDEATAGITKHQEEHRQQVKKLRDDKKEAVDEKDKLAETLAEKEGVVASKTRAEQEKAAESREKDAAIVRYTSKIAELEGQLKQLKERKQVVATTMALPATTTVNTTPAATALPSLLAPVGPKPVPAARAAQTTQPARAPAAAPPATVAVLKPKPTPTPAAAAPNPVTDTTFHVPTPTTTAPALNLFGNSADAPVGNSPIIGGTPPAPLQFGAGLPGIQSLPGAGILGGLGIASDGAATSSFGTSFASPAPFGGSVAGTPPPAAFPVNTAPTTPAAFGDAFGAAPPTGPMGGASPVLPFGQSAMNAGASVVGNTFAATPPQTTAFAAPSGGFAAAVSPAQAGGGFGGFSAGAGAVGFGGGGAAGFASTPQQPAGGGFGGFDAGTAVNHAGAFAGGGNSSFTAIGGGGGGGFGGGSLSAFDTGTAGSMGMGGARK